MLQSPPRGRSPGRCPGEETRYVNPAVAALLGIVLLHEPFGLSLIIGMTLILLGSWMAASRREGDTGKPPGWRFARLVSRVGQAIQTICRRELGIIFPIIIPCTMWRSAYPNLKRTQVRACGLACGRRL